VPARGVGLADVLALGLEPGRAVVPVLAVEAAVE